MVDCFIMLNLFLEMIRLNKIQYMTTGEGNLVTVNTLNLSLYYKSV